MPATQPTAAGADGAATLGRAVRVGVEGALVERSGAAARLKGRLLAALLRRRYLVARVQATALERYGPRKLAIFDRVAGRTMNSPERLSALIDAVEYVERAAIPGAIVECGVWRGGSMMAVALTLPRAERELYLFDTYAGMTAPTEADSDLRGVSALEVWPHEDFLDGAAPLEVVRAAMASTGYDERLVHYVEGPVEETVPDRAPEQIALLQLDTCWYESTRHELEQLYPRLAPGGVLIIDDYGHFAGSRRAVDEYFGDALPFLAAPDYTGRIAIKPAEVR